MTTIKLVSETYIRENTPLNQNVDTKDIMPNIIPAQDIHLQPVLGTDLYNEILVAYSAQTLTASQTTLVSYIKPMVAYKAATMALPFIQFQIKNKGIQSQFGDYSNSVDEKVLNYMMNELNNRYEFYSQRLIDYLTNNSSLFPSYSTNTNEDISPDTRTAYDCGIVFYGGGSGCNKPNNLI